MPITSFPEEAIFCTWSQKKAITGLLHLGEDITRSEELYDQNFVQLRLTNSFELFFFLTHVIAHHIAAITWGKFLLL